MEICDSNKLINKCEEPKSPQCQFFVLRKKRLCRMTVRPGHRYCGEHEPEPKTDFGLTDNRVPCPNDPKHTCYVSKLEKHLKICNARPTEFPPYIRENINAPPDSEPPLKVLLSQVPKEKMVQLINKINNLYDKYIKDNIEILENQDIHEAVMEEFQDAERTESSLRHLRQVSSLLRLVEGRGLARPYTCYVELGAGKGHLSYHAWRAWCSDEGSSRVLLLDRASLRHKRDNKLPRHESVCRVRADLAHVWLPRVPAVEHHHTRAVVGLAKHLCGVATDYALRCLLSAGSKTAGAVLATCCHHRCRWTQHLGREHLQDMGIDRYEFEIMLRLVSWATCGTGRPRQHRGQSATNGHDTADGHDTTVGHDTTDGLDTADGHDTTDGLDTADGHDTTDGLDTADGHYMTDGLDTADGHYTTDGHTNADGHDTTVGHDTTDGLDTADGHDTTDGLDTADGHDTTDGHTNANGHDTTVGHDTTDGQDTTAAPNTQNSEATSVRTRTTANESIDSLWQREGEVVGPCARVEQRAEVGRRAKVLLDWARVLRLRRRGLAATLCRFVPGSVTPENVCIVAASNRAR